MAEEREQRQATTRMLKGPAEFLDYFPDLLRFSPRRLDDRRPACNLTLD